VAENSGEHAAGVMATGDLAQPLVNSDKLSARQGYVPLRASTRIELVIKLVVDLSHGDQADVARSYEFFRKIEFFQKARRMSTSEVQSLVDVLKRIGVLDRQMGADALLMQGVTP
jgi:hypothetical protein